VQNDINPGNVMLPADFSRAVLIDFDSARPEGYKFTAMDKFHTTGFSRDKMEVSELEGDLYGLERIRLWLEDPEAVEVPFDS
jgi:hypothetical protein